MLSYIWNGCHFSIVSCSFVKNAALDIFEQPSYLWLDWSIE